MKFEIITLEKAIKTITKRMEGLRTEKLYHEQFARQCQKEMDEIKNTIKKQLGL